MRKYGKQYVRDDAVVVPEPIFINTDDDYDNEMERLGMALTYLEKQMNNIVWLHYPQVGKDKEGRDEEEHKNRSLIKEMNSKIIACPTCWERKLGKEAFWIHMNEIHSTSIVTEAESPQNETKMKMALGMMKK